MTRSILALILFVCLFSTTSTAQQQPQLICSPDLEGFEQQINGLGEKLLFAGTSLIGIPFRFYTGKDTYSMLFFNPQAGWCTGAPFNGRISTPIQPQGVGV